MEYRFYFPFNIWGKFSKIFFWSPLWDFFQLFFSQDLAIPRRNSSFHYLIIACIGLRFNLISTCITNRQTNFNCFDISIMHCLLIKKEHTFPQSETINTSTDVSLGFILEFSFSLEINSKRKYFPQNFY